MPKDILGTKDGESYFVGSNAPVAPTVAPPAPITRYTNPTPPPTLPVPTPASTNPILSRPTGPAPVDENAIREETRKRMQSSIDAINANYADIVAQEQVTGQDRSGQTRAINARSGLIGSDFGTAQAEKTTQFNKQQVKYIEDEKAAKVAAIMQGIEDRATEEIRARKAEALGQYERDSEAYAAAQEQARGDLKTLAGSGVDLESLNPAQRAALLKQAGYEDNDMTSLIYNAMKPKASQIDYKFEKLADGQGLFYGVDPVTGDLVTKNVSVDLPPDWQMQIAPDGTVLGFNKNTGETQMLSEQGQFMKPETGLDSKAQARVDGIVKQFDNEPIVRNFNVLAEGYQFAKNIATNTTNPSDDIGMIYAFAKIMDPNSVVREGEYATVQKYAQSWADSFGFNAKRIFSNSKFLSSDAIANMKATIEQKYVASEQNYQNVYNEYGRRVNMITGSADGTDYLTDYAGAFDSVTADISLTPLNGNDPRRFSNPLVAKYPYQEVASFVQQYPDATEAEIQELVNGGTTDKGGGSFTKAVKTKYPTGYNGGQCGDFAHKIVSFPQVGDSKSEKIASVSKYGIPASQWKKQVRVGDVVITGENPTYGHVCVVNAILPNGQIRVTESNYKQSNKVSHTRILSLNSPLIYGAIRGKLKT